MKVPVLEVRDLEVSYAQRRRRARRGASASVSAVASVNLRIEAGETLALVGESGCGKTSLARAVVGLQAPSRGSILINGRDRSGLSGREARRLCKDVQMVFQDPASSLNPRKTVHQILQAGWRGNPEIAQPADPEQAVADLLRRVGIDPDHASRLPHQFSGGQQQRIGVARALSVRPHLIVCDEAVSALDVSIRAQIVNLLQDLQEELGVAYLFIAHDLSIVRHVADTVAVMYLGKVVELGARDEVLFSPCHPYTQSLLSAVPVTRPWELRRERVRLRGEPPSPMAPPSGCRFHPRCPKSQEICSQTEPRLSTHFGRLVACHFAEPTFVDNSGVLTAGPSIPCSPERGNGESL